METVDQDSPIGMEVKYDNHLGKLKTYAVPTDWKNFLQWHLITRNK